MSAKGKQDAVRVVEGEILPPEGKEQPQGQQPPQGQEQPQGQELGQQQGQQPQGQRQNAGEDMAAAAVRELPATVRGFGDRNQIAAVRQRMLAMIPNAAEAPSHVVFAAAQLAVAYGLNFLTGEIYLANMGTERKPNWQPVVGVKGWRKKAREKSNFMTQERVMTAEEVQRARGALYRPEDVGVEVTLWRMDVAMQCKVLGIPYSPLRAQGFWRKCARLKDEWVNNQKTGNQIEVEDNVPESWTREMVASKRAEVNAIKKGFDLNFGVMVTEGDMPGEADVFMEMGRMIASHDRDNAPPADPNLIRESDGDILYAS